MRVEAHEKTVPNAMLSMCLQCKLLRNMIFSFLINIFYIAVYFVICKTKYFSHGQISSSSY